MNLLTTVFASALLFLSTSTAFQVTSPISLSRKKPQTIFSDTLSEVEQSLSTAKDDLQELTNKGATIESDKET